jgi:hypothetical protein
MCLGKNHNDNIKAKHLSNQSIGTTKFQKIYILRSFLKIRKMFSRIGGKTN